MQRTTLGELASWEPPPDELDCFQSFINIIDEFYPDDWRSWEVNNVSYEDLFGDRISSDEECRLRFAVPTLHLAYAFSEGPPSLSERKYKRIKRQLITWPLGRAIIYSPFATMKKIHPTDAGNRFSEVLSVLKSELMSRAEAAKILQNTHKKSRSPFKMPSKSQKLAHSPIPTSYKKARYEDCDTLTDFLKHQKIILEKLCKLSEDQNENIKQIREKMYNKCGNLDIEKTHFENASEIENWHARSYNQIEHEDTRDIESPTDELLEDSASTVSFDTTENEEMVSVAEESLVKQGIASQRLGTDGWLSINYIEGQKKFQAAPVFTNLQINSHLAAITPSAQHVTVLEKMDLCLGGITHGLLQQRKEFQEIYKKATLEVKSVISKYFLSFESSFRRTSDTLLQYTCGKRAQIIQQRRSIYKPSNQKLYELLHAIPPSATHLFSEPKLSALLKEQGGINKFFPDKYQKLKQEGRKDSTRELGPGDKTGSSGTNKRIKIKTLDKAKYRKRRTRSNAS
ncbi:hypothetical protein PYW07_016914 [Mythimna separata]|uniref:Uncharacterized protein n=1 Tax=Mythimna separata TaxID=271217 RepID=A0AAD8DXW9_MYTSE|nr:hypothetical protein PYW07_016914 [Mythimna separata]